jgi:SAM-dependent methyltransferase
MSADAKQAAWERLMGYAVGYQAVWIIDVGLRSGMLSAIAGAPGGTDDEVLAGDLGFDHRLVRLWCRTAYAFELLDWDEHGGFRLAPGVESLLLDSTDPMFMGGRLQFIAALYEDFKAFPAYLSSGGVWPRSEHDPWILEALKASSQPDSGVWTDVVLPQAPGTLAVLEVGGRLLDIGAGAGSALVHYARRFPRSQVIGLELDEPSIELARQAIADAGLTDRIEIRRGDANELEDEDTYDLVTMSITLHETGGPDEYRNVLRRVHRALRPGGTLLVAELPYPDSPEAYRQQPVYRLLAGVQVHEALVGCGAITQGELPALLGETGFGDVRVAEQPMPTRFVMLATKSSSELH